ncbi:hypothetical protein EOM57_01215 [Candidatus Saccharibacteria bacterium]|nr:hypothetical protein [Candidatus Saccharibacteria bacterium]
MLDLKEEKRDAENFITDVVKQLKPSDKQRVADMLAGFALATPKPKKNGPSYPSGSVHASCG